MIGMRKAWTLALTAALAAVGLPAHALDIDQIEVQSGLGEPLRAQIAIVSNDPAELVNLQAQLASAATFARAGLQRPQGAVADLRFAIAKDARGRPVIRITSGAPMREDFFTFLIVLDWNGGHLVREYSVALANPGTLNATPAPLIQAPVVAPSNAIVRAPEVGTAPIPLAGQAAPPASLPAPVAATIPAPIPLVGQAANVPPPPPPRPRDTAADSAIPAPPKPASPKPASKPIADIKAKSVPAAKPKAETAAAPKPAPAAKPAPAPATPAKPGAEAKPGAATAPDAKPDAKPAAAVPAAGERVEAGDTLTAIVARMDDAGHTRDQMMLALLRSNPEAFIGGNINRIRKDAVLRAPDAAELSRFGAAEAAVMVRDQINQWRGGQPTTPQPVALAGDAPRTPAADRPAPGAAAPARRPRAGAAHLEIVPAAAAQSGVAGTRSGIGDGDGRMLRQAQLEHDETVASRDVEIAELKQRLAGLEKIQADQQKLIRMQSSELAAAQQRSAEVQRRAQSGDRVPVWPWLAGALAVLAALVWLVMRRRAPAPPTRLFEERPADAPAAAFAAAEPDLTAGFPTWHDDDDGSAVAAAGGRSDGAKRLQIARAYRELGDLDAARRVLREVVDGDDAQARDTAARLLREIG